MEIHLPYDRTYLTARLPDSLAAKVIAPQPVEAAADPQRLVRAALSAPLGGARLEAFGGAASVAIAINDKTRPVPHAHLLPPLLETLEATGFTPAAITLVVATGMHPPMATGEFVTILPAAILERYRVVSHDAEDAAGLVYRGETGRGTPVWVNRRFAEAQLRIVIGNIEPHQFVGFSGGVKSAAIGLGGVATIQRNHSLMLHPAARLGDYETNPARQDVEEIGERIGIHFALNAVLNHAKAIVHVLAGEPRALMVAGLPLARQVCQVQVAEEYDLLVASPGGYPKDINLYQAQKGLAHAALVTRPGGTIILVAACPEGTGSRHYETWMQGKQSMEEVIECFGREGFRVGPHKAYQIARDAARVRLITCTEMDKSQARALLLNPAASLQEAVDVAVADLPSEARVGVMPNAASTIPYRA